MSNYTRWRDVRSGHVERARGESAVASGKDQLLATVRGHRLADIRHNRGLTQQDIADRMGITKGRKAFPGYVSLTQASPSGHGQRYQS